MTICQRLIQVPSLCAKPWGSSFVFCDGRVSFISKVVERPFSRRLCASSEPHTSKADSWRLSVDRVVLPAQPTIV
jgi:hypothetical protein